MMNKMSLRVQGHLRSVITVLTAMVLFAGVILTSWNLLYPIDAMAADASKQYVTDNADLFTTAEEKKLESLCQKASEDCKTDIIIITMNDGLDGSALDNHVRHILETSYGYQGSGTDCDAIAYVIDMGSRADRVVTSGNTRNDNITQKQLDHIREAAENKLKNGNYYAGCTKYVNGVERRMNKSLTYQLTLYLPIKLLIAAVVAVVAVLAMMFHAKSRMTVGSNTYARGHQGNLLARDDQYINTTVVTRHIQTNNGSGGGGGGGGGNSGSSGGHF